MLYKLKTVLNVGEDDKKLLRIYIENAESKIKVRLGMNEVPDLFEYVIVDYVVYKFRRKGLEDAKSISEDVLSKTFTNDKEFFEQYEDDFFTFLNNENKKVKLRFIGYARKTKVL